MHIIKQQQL